jgi:hypothetical protein
MQEGLACAVHGISRREGQREALFSVLSADGAELIGNVRAALPADLPDEGAAGWLMLEVVPGLLAPAKNIVPDSSPDSAPSRRLLEQRQRIKWAIIDLLRAEPSLSLTGLTEQVGLLHGWPAADLARVLIATYASAGASAGLWVLADDSPEECFKAIKVFVTTAGLDTIRAALGE